MRSHIELGSYLLVLVCLAFPLPANSSSDAVKSEREEFFESKVRPLLVKNCYACHTDLKSGGLRLRYPGVYFEGWEGWTGGHPR